MSVIGIDFGNESCYVAVARAGGIETIANDYSLRSTPSCVAFSSKNRILGVAAKNQMVTNMNNTVHGFKRLLGRNFTDPYVENELKHLPFQCVQTNTGGIGLKVNFLDEAHVFTPEQVTSMLFTKLKDVAETALKTKVNDCVISVPSYFTNNERKALLDAAAIAGLNVLRLFNETTATALAYGIYKQDLPEDKPRNVVFVDAGHASLQVSACAFHKGKLKMLASASDVSLGGRDIDDILAGHFADEFVTRYRIDARKNARAWLRLTAEVEKIKKQMSANSTKLPLNIECFMDDKDVHSDMKRSDMETLCADLFQRAGDTMRKCLEDSKLKLEEIYAVEIVGGSSRVPAIKQLIEQIFRVPASTTLNQDEAVSRGCALQCAMLSPAIRVREFNVTDIQNFPVKLVWEQNGEIGEMEVFEKNHPVPFSKMLTFYRKEQFSMRAYYMGVTPYPDPYIGEFIIKEVKPTPAGESQKVKVKVRVNLNGIVSVTSASLLDKLSPSEQADSPDDPEPDQDQDGGGAGGGAGEGSSGQSEEGEVVVVSDKKEKKKKATVKTVELPIEAHVGGFSVAQVNMYHELEGKMISGDRQEKERVDARNALEEYVYDIRGKLTSEDELASFVAEADRSRLCQDLDRTETWLYEEGEDCARNVYADRLSKLKGECEPIKLRRAEWELRPLALQELAAAIQLGGKAVEQFRSGDARYAHLTARDVDKVAADLDAALVWLEDARHSLATVAQSADAALTCAAIRHEKQALEALVSPVMNKPRPEVEVVSPPPPPPPPKKDEVDGQGDHVPRETTEHEEMDVE